MVYRLLYRALPVPQLAGVVLAVIGLEMVGVSVLGPTLDWLAQFVPDPSTWFDWSPW